MISEEDRFKANPQVIDTILDDDEATLVNLDTKLSYALNKTGLRIWTFLKEGSTIGEIADSIQKEFEVDRERARRDTAKLAERLVVLNLLSPIQQQDTRI